MFTAVRALGKPVRSGERHYSGTAGKLGRSTTSGSPQPGQASWRSTAVFSDSVAMGRLSRTGRKLGALPVPGRLATRWVIAPERLARTPPDFRGVRPRIQWVQSPPEEAGDKEARSCGRDPASAGGRRESCGSASCGARPRWDHHREAMLFRQGKGLIAVFAFRDRCRSSRRTAAAGESRPLDRESRHGAPPPFPIRGRDFRQRASGREASAPRSEHGASTRTRSKPL